MKRRNVFLLSLVVFGVSVGVALAAPKNSYQATILAGNEADEGFHTTDPLLQNSWGLAASSSGPWWVTNNGSNSSTLYNGAGDKLPLEVLVPGAPTGEVFYGGSSFVLSNGSPARFIWAAEDGTFSAWNGTLSTTVPQQSEVIFSDPEGIYKGLAVHGDVLYTTDFASCEVEAFAGNPNDQTFAEFDTAGGFEDDSIPAGFCPFGIQAIGDSFFVSYALKSGVDDVAGQGNGFVRQFDTDGNLIAAIADEGQLNSPWGMTQAPSDFGRVSGCLLVGNFGDGTINAYCQNRGGDWHFGGTLKENKRPIVIEGLWGLAFGNNGQAGLTNELFFTAGPDEEVNGYFGKIVAAP